MVRSSTERSHVPFNQFPLMVTSFKTIVKYQIRLLTLMPSRYRTFLPLKASLMFSFYSHFDFSSATHPDLTTSNY